MSSAYGTSIQTLAGVPGGSQSRMPATAGSAVSSPVISTQSVPDGGRKSTPALSSTTGPRMVTRSPGRAVTAQRDAGPDAMNPAEPASDGSPTPCSAKSMSNSSRGYLRCSRTVYERMMPRTSGSMACQTVNHDSPASAGTTGASWPGWGRNSLKRWSRPPEANSRRRVAAEGDAQHRGSQPSRPQDVYVEELERDGTGGDFGGCGAHVLVLLIGGPWRGAVGGTARVVRSAAFL